MDVKFSIHKTPIPKHSGNSDKSANHARVQTKGTKRIDEINDYINEVSSLSPADIKGALEALFQFISLSLRDGYNVELENFGVFSLSLKSTHEITKTGRKVLKIAIDGVNFKCCPRLKNKIQRTRLKKEKRPTDPFPLIEERKKRMISYIEDNGYINTARYLQLNGGTYYRAQKDLEAFEKENFIIRSGRGTHKIYLLPENV